MRVYPPATAAEIQGAISKLLLNMARWNSVTNGPATGPGSIVETDNDLVKTIARLQLEMPDVVRDAVVNQLKQELDLDFDLAIKGGQEALDRARELGLSLIDAAASNLDGILSEERIRNTEIKDALDRMSLFGLADPILRTGILRREVILEGMGPSGDETFIQMETRLVAADSALSLGVAQVLIDAKAYTSSQISAAFAVLASKAEMAAAISASEVSLKAYADNTVATATAGLVTVSRLNTAIADSRLALETWTNGQISTATAGLMTASQVDGKIAASELAMKSYADGKVATATAGLATVVQVDNKIAAAELVLKSYADGKVATATAGLATVVQVDNKIAAAELVLKSYADDKVAQGTAGLATKAELGSAIGASELTLKTYTDGKVATAVSGLISAVEVDNKIAAASLTLNGQIDSKIATATANLVTVSQMNGALAGAELTLKSYADQAVVTGTANLAAKSDVLVRGNILPNSTGADGATGWALGGAWQALSTGAGGPRFESAGTFTSATTSDPIAGIIPGDILTLSADFRRQMTSGSVAADLIWLNASGGQISISARIFVSTNRDYGERLSIQLTAPANTAQCRVRFFVENPVENLGSGIRRIKLERGASPATPWIDSAADMRLWSLVGIQGETLINVNDRLEQASLRLVAAASGGNPAIVELYSSSAGDSNIRLRARQIQFGENTVLDTTTGLQVSVFGTTRRVVAQGAAFGAAPDAGQLTEWEGANSVPLDGMTRANAYYFRANTEPRHGGSAVNGSVPFKVISTHRSIGATRSGIGTVTTPLVTFSAQGAIGPVSFDVYFVDGDNSITATNPSSDDADAPFEHQTAFRTSLTQLGQQKTARMVCAVRDSVGNTGSAYLGIGLTELS